MSPTIGPIQDLQRARALLASLQSAEASLVSARELVFVAQERVRLAKDRIKFAEERKEHLTEALVTAHENLANARLVLSGANDLCRLSRRYLAGIQSSPEETANRNGDAVEVSKALEAMLESANELVMSAGRTLMIAYGQAGKVDYELKRQERRVALETGRFQHQQAVWVLANELLAVAEDQLERAQDRVKLAEDRVARIKSRIGYK